MWTILFYSFVLSCTPQVLVTPRDWAQRPKLMAAVRRELAGLPQRVGYYPGTAAKHQAFRTRFAGKKVGRGASWPGCSLRV